MDVYVKELQMLSKSCEFGALRDSLIKDRLVGGINNDRVRQRLLEKSALTLDSAVQIVHAAEQSKIQAQIFKTDGAAEVAAVSKHRYKKNFQGTSKEEKKWKPVQRSQRKCGRCGTSHARNKCSAWNKTCTNCGRPNHFSQMCLFKGQKPRQKVDEVTRDGDNDDEDENEDENEEAASYYIGEVTQRKMKSKDWIATVEIEKKKISIKLDTGAQCNLLPLKLYEEITNKQLDSSKVQLKTYSREKLQPVGQKVLPVKSKGLMYKLLFQVVKDDFAPIIGGEDCEKMNLVMRAKCVDEVKEASILDEYPEVFKGLGKLPGTYHITIDPSVNPVVHPPRRVPHALKEKLQEELERMEKDEIIVKVSNNEPSDWVNSLVTVLKPNGQVRVCIDPKDLNRAIKREHYPLSTAEEIAAKVNGANFFSTLDAEKAFYQISLDEQSQNLLTFNTPFGRYKYRRMPMGITSAPEVYQHRMKQVFEGLDGVEVMMDDVLIWGKNEKEHNDRLRAALERVKNNNLTLNKKKCKLMQEEIKYLGHKFTKDGLLLDEEKVRAIVEMPEPTDKQGIMRLLGMMNYLSRFIPNMSQLTAPIRVLLKDDTAWHWGPDQVKCFKEIKKVLSQAPLLAYYNPNKSLILQVDASSKGVGATLIQEGRPVAYASKALTHAQQQYAQIEKELLAIVFGCTKFDDYIIGRKTTVQSDHRPLESIFKKHLHEAPARLQKMLIQLQRYPGIEVVYTKGKEVLIADALSRAYIPEQMTDIDVSVVVALPSNSIDKLVKETEKDEALIELKQVIQNGWPDNKSDIPISCRIYWNYREELTCFEGVILKGQRIVIPEALRREMLKKLHASHMGIVKTKQRARDTMYWPGMSEQIEGMIKECTVCLQNQRQNSKEELQPHEIPNRVWTKIGTDLFTYEGHDYVVCIDYYSKFPEVRKLDATTSRGVVSALKSIFATHGRSIQR